MEFGENSSSMEAMETMEQAAENVADGGQSFEGEKTYTQAEVDNIVKGRLARERSKARSFGEDFSAREVNIPKSTSENINVSGENIKSQVERDREWFENTVGGDFIGFIRSDEFREFMEGTNISVRKGMEKFIKTKGADAVKNAYAKKVAKTASTGSVKDSGASSLKEYYTPDEVDNLSAADFKNPEIMKRVRQSMTKW